MSLQIDQRIDDIVQRIWGDGVKYKKSTFKLIPEISNYLIKHCLSVICPKTKVLFPCPPLPTYDSTNKQNKMYDVKNVSNYPTTTHTSVSVGGSGGGGRGVVPELLDG